MTDLQKSIQLRKLYDQGRREELERELDQMHVIPVCSEGISHRDLFTLGYCEIEMTAFAGFEGELDVQPLKGKQFKFI